MGKQVVNWCIISPKTLDDLLEEAVKEGTYRTKSDLVRDAVRDKLEKMGFFFRKKLKLRGSPPNEPN